MTPEEKGLLLTVARILRARIKDPGGSYYDGADLEDLNEALAPFDPDPDAPVENTAEAGT